MKIDRSRFLLLAAALSANACTIVDARGQEDTGVASDTATVTDATADDAATEAAADSTIADGGSDTTTATEAAADAATDGVSSDGVSSDVTAAADAIDAHDAPACTNEGFTAAECNFGDAGCSTTALECTNWKTYLKSKLAKKAVDSLLALPTCEGVDLAPCLTTAFDEVCLDEDVTTFCTTLAGSCVTDDAGTDADAGTATDAGTDAATDAAPTSNPAQLLTDCKKYAPGLLSAGRTRLQEVVTSTDEGRCTVPLRDMLGQL